MKKIKHLLAGLSLFAALSAPAFLSTPASAQATTPPATPAAPGAPKAARQNRGGGRRLNVGTMPIGTLDYVVSLKDDQKTKITDIQTKAKDDAKAAAGDRPKITEVNTKAAADIEAILTDEQKTKLKDATPMLQMLQQSRAVSLASLPDLKLTDDQKTKINAAVTDAQTKMKAVPRGDQAARQTVLADFKTAIDGVLTDDQKKMATAPRAKKVK